MRVLKIIGILIGILLVLVIILGLIVPGDFVAERKITIDAPTELVFHHVRFWRNWQDWSPWAEMDSTMSVAISGVDGQEGAVYSWTSASGETGKGEMLTTKLIPNVEIQYQLHFIDPYESYADGWLRLKPVDGNETEAAWGFSGEMSFPWNITTLFVSMEQMIAPDFDRGLAKLKEISEREYGQIAAYEVQTVDYPEMIYAVVRDEIQMAELKDFFGQSYQVIITAMGKKGVRMKGHPCALYYRWDEQRGRTDVAAAIPINRSFASEDVESIVLNERKAFKIDYYGAYESLSVAHRAMDVYLAQNNRTHVSPVIEEYVTDPMAEPDNAKWLTRIYYFTD